jgi:hypothetical protein
MEPAELPSIKPVEASRLPILSYHAPAMPGGNAQPSYLLVAACGVIALLLFSFGIYLVLNLALGSLGTSGWVMISVLVAPFVFLGGAMLVSRIGCRRAPISPPSPLPPPDKESACAQS